jgi:DNA-binding NarL/FixJ family response regulator
MFADAPSSPVDARARRPGLRLVPGGPDDPVADLTPREAQVLGLMARGRSNHAICEELHISPKTLERHVQHVFAKLGLPPHAASHRRVCAVLAWLNSPAGRA